MTNFQMIVSPDIVDVLRREHDQIRRLCADVRLTRPGRRQSSLAALQRAVHLHQLGELRVAHPPVRNSGPAGDGIALEIQARGAQLERLLAELGHLGVAHPDFDAGFEAVSGGLLGHAAQQESEEFPLLHRHVSVQRLHMMAGEMRDVQVMALD